MSSSSSSSSFDSSSSSSSSSSFYDYATVVPTLDVYHVCPSTIKNKFYQGYFAFDTSTSLLGSSNGKTWLSHAGEKTKQRINVDLGRSCVIKRLKYVNYHDKGGDINEGAQYFQIYGSNFNIMYDAYDRADNLTLVWSGRLNRCTFETVPPFVFPNPPIYTPIPQYVIISNTSSYRYYAIKIGNNWEGNSGIGLRRIELQEKIS